MVCFPPCAIFCSIRGHRIDSLGKALLLCEYKTKYTPIEFEVVINESNILGMNWHEDCEMDRKHASDTLSEFTNVFTGLGCITKAIHHPRDLNKAIKREYSTTTTPFTRILNAKVFFVLDASSGFWQDHAHLTPHLEDTCWNASSLESLLPRWIETRPTEGQSNREHGEPNEQRWTSKILGYGYHLAMFIPNLSQTASLLRVLLEKDTGHTNKQQISKKK